MQAVDELKKNPVDSSSDEDKSSMNESDDSDMMKKGINMTTVRKVMVGLQADTSSDEEKIP